jgi:superfamily II DNA or RNA helicase
MLGPAYVRRGTLIRNKGLILSQDRTIAHAWDRIRHNGRRAFLVADAVGRGKSYMALGIAMGFWRAARKATFRVAVLAPTRELSSAWMKKLAEGHDRSRFADLVRVIDGRAPTDARDYFGAYLPEFRRGAAQAVVYSVRTRYEAKRLWHATRTPELADRLKRRKRIKRIEVVVTSPRFLTRPKDSAVWRRWCERVDVVIADEAYGFRNDFTAYGRLMRPDRGTKGKVFRHRPWLVALSATLLSKDMQDTRDVVSVLIDWGPRGKGTEKQHAALQEACRQYRASLDTALQTQGRDVGAYNRASLALIRVLRRYMSRLPTLRNRAYERWLTHQRDYARAPIPAVRNFPFAQPAVNYEAVAARLDDQGLERDLTRFLAEASRNGQDRTPATLRSWRRLTEIEGTKRNGGPPWPKPDALGRWLGAHIEAIWRTPDKQPRFKVVVYCHHVDTAKVLARGLAGEGRGHRRRPGVVETELRRAWKHLAAQERALFSGFYTRRTASFDAALDAAGISRALLKDLPTRNATLLVAALLNARGEVSERAKAAAFIRTLSTWRPAPKDPPVLRVLQRIVPLRTRVLETLHLGRLARWASSLPAADKKRRAVGWFIFNNTRVRDALAELPLDPRLAGITRRIGRVDMRTTDAARLAEAIADRLYDDRSVRRLLRRWNRDVSLVARAKEREDLERFREHRTSSVVEVLTGENPERRNAVSQDFLSPGSPFVLVLTNVCSMGIDLHHYCWDVVHYSPSWTPSEFEQKSGRIDRPRPRVLRDSLRLGDERHSSAIRVHHFLWPFTYDERVFRRMNARGHLSERLLSSKLVREADDKTAEAFRRLKPLALSPA